MKKPKAETEYILRWAQLWEGVRSLSWDALMLLEMGQPLK